MNGLLSSQPSPTAIRLILGGFLLQNVPAFFVVRTEEIDVPLRALTTMVLFISLGTLIGAIIGEPRDTTPYWKRWRR